MIRNTMGIILTSEDQIHPLTDIRANSALPVAGRYRIIDFVLSNMVDAGITNIGVATESNYSSLMDHIKSGKPWDLDRKRGGLNILPPSIEQMHQGFIRGNIDMLAGIRDYIHRSREEYVILNLGNNIYNMDLAAVVEEHIRNQSDITVVYKDFAGSEESELSRYTLIEMEEDGRVVDIEVQPYYPKTTTASLDIYVLEKVLLESIIDECSARGDSDLAKDAFIKKMSGMRIYGYEHKGYNCKVDSMKAYYTANMNFLNGDVRKELFNPERPIFTKSKAQTPTKYGAEASVYNSFISDGCVIEGEVQNCILSRGVKIAKGAIVRNSIIMQDGVIEEGVELDCVVFDKEVHVTKGRKLIGQENAPLAIEKGTKI